MSDMSNGASQEGVLALHRSPKRTPACVALDAVDFTVVRKSSSGWWAKTGRGNRP